MGSKKSKRGARKVIELGGVRGPAIGTCWVASPACLEMKAGSEQSMLGSPVVSGRWDGTIGSSGLG